MGAGSCEVLLLILGLLGTAAGIIAAGSSMSAERLVLARAGMPTSACMLAPAAAVERSELVGREACAGRGATG